MKKTDIAAIYQNRFHNDIAYRKQMWNILIRDFFQKYVPPTSIVLDVATGYGEFITHIRAKKKFACDINPDTKKYLQKDVTFFQSPSTKIPLKNNSVDSIFVSNFFEHITREEITNTIKEFNRVLKKKGNVLILQPNIRFCAKDYWMFFDHITPVDDRALVEVFGNYKFKLIKRIERFLPYSTKSNLPKNFFFLKLYLRIPLLWYFFGKQSFLLFEK